MRRYGIVASEATLLQRPNDIEIKHYKSTYSLQQFVKLILPSKGPTGPEMTNVNNSNYKTNCLI